MDQYIVQESFQSKNEDQQKRVRCLLIECYCNIAIVSIKIENYAVALDACDQSLSIDPKHVRALYLRSKARILPKSSGALEQKMAILDLEAIMKIAPSNNAAM